MGMILKMVGGIFTNTQRGLFSNLVLNRFASATARLLACLAIFAPCAILAGEVVPGFVSITSEGEAQFHFVGPLPPGQSVFIQTPTKYGTMRCCQRLSRSDLHDEVTPPNDVTNIVGNPVSS